MQTKHAPLLFAAVLAGAAACGTYATIDGIEVQQALYDQAVEKVKTRAAFELTCPREQIMVTVLDADDTGTLRQLGARGCDKKVVYVFVPHSGWVMNTESGEKPGDGKQ